MDRRSFLRRLGAGAVAVAAVPRLLLALAPRTTTVSNGLTVSAGGATIERALNRRLRGLERALDRQLAMRGYQIELTRHEDLRAVIGSITTLAPSTWNTRFIVRLPGRTTADAMTPAGTAQFLLRQIKFQTIKCVEALDEARINGRVSELGDDGVFRWVPIG